MKVMHDGGKEFTSNKFKNFLSLRSIGIKDKQIPKGYPAYNKIAIAEFPQEEELRDEKEKRMGQRNTNYLSIHNTMREHGEINGMTSVEEFMKSLKQWILID